MSDKTEHPVPQAPPQLSCEVCLTEIPSTVAHTVEGEDYVHHFCGTDCLERWHQADPQGKPREA